MNDLAKIRYDCLEREVPYDKEIIISFNDSERLIINEIWIRQYLNSRFNNHKFRKSIYHSISTKKKYKGLIPPFWIEIIENYDIKCNRFIIRIKWIIRSIIHLVYTLYKVISASIKNTEENNVRSFFWGLSQDNIPDNFIKQESIFSWAKSAITDLNDSQFYHDVPNCQNDNPKFTETPYSKLTFKSVQNYLSATGFIFGLVKTAIKSRETLILLLSWEFTKAFIEHLEGHKKFKNHIFNNSNYLYRPIWSYVSEYKGVNIWFYFYSINNHEIDLKNQRIEKYLFNSWNLITWSKIICWKDNLEHIKLYPNTTNAIVKVNSPPSMQPYTLEPEITENIFDIVIFDVQPYNYEEFMAFGLKNEYYTEKNCIKFLSDILEVIDEMGLRVAFKRKRKESPKISKAYLEFIQTYKFNNILEIPPNTSAHELISKSRCTISIPFTSTYFISEFLNIPGCFYDPTGLVISENHIINNKTDLRKFIINSIKK